jgi:PAS domain S-box-containing protein
LNRTNAPHSATTASANEPRELRGERHAKGAAEAMESKLWQEALQQSEKHLRTLLEASPDDPAQLKDASGRWLEANRATIDLFGLQGVDYRGKTDAELARVEGAEQSLLGCAATDEAAWRLRGRSRVEEVVRTRDGTFRTFDVIKVPLFDADGGRNVLVILARDITERKRVESERARLLERERDARLAAERAERQAAFLAEVGRSLSTSLDYEGMLSLAADLPVPFLARFCIVCRGDDEYGTPPCVVAPRDDPRAIALARKELDPASRSGAALALRTGMSFIGKAPLSAASLGFRADAAELVASLGESAHMVVPLLARGRIGGAMIFLSNEGASFSAADLGLAEEVARRAAMAIDNARLYEDAQRAIRVREDFLLVASHELRTPCTSLTLGVQGLLRRARAGTLTAVPSGRVEATLGTCERQIHQLNLLVDRLLDVAQLQSDRLLLDLERVDLAALAREAVDGFAEVANRADSRLELHGASVPVVGRWDRSRLQQVVVNLLNNAIKYGAGKAIELRIETAGSCARLVVRDRGIGIAQEHQQRVFDAFERAVSPREFAGLGLGLYIVRQIVAAHEGFLRLESAPDQGSTFCVELPIAGPAS